jgi:DNA polymerase-3 subunit beta
MARFSVVRKPEATARRVPAKGHPTLRVVEVAPNVAEVRQEPVLVAPRGGFAVRASDLAPAVAAVQKVVSRKSTLPVLGCIRLRWAKQAVTIDGTNLDQHLQVTVAAATRGKGEAIQPAGDLANILKGAERSAPLTAVLRGSLFTWQVGNRQGVCAIQIDAADWPNVDGPAGQVWTKPRAVPATWLDGMRRVLVAVAPDESRPVLSGLLWQGDQLVAADGFRLHLATVPNQAQGTARVKAYGLIIPGYALQRLPKLGAAPLQVSLRLVRAPDGDRQPTGKLTAPQALRLVQGGVQFTTRLIEGTFPDYMKIIPTRTAWSVEFDAAVWARELRTLEPAARDHFFNVRLERKGQRVLMRVGDQGRTVAVVPARKATGRLGGERGAVAFNIRYLREAIEAAEADVLTLAGNHHTQPGVVRVGKQPFAVIMPILLND